MRQVVLLVALLLSCGGGKANRGKGVQRSSEAVTVPTLAPNSYMKLDTKDPSRQHTWSMRGQQCQPCQDEIAASWGTVRSSSELEGYPPQNIRLPLRLDQAWCEGVDGPGLGEWIEYRFTTPIQLAYLEVSPGFTKTRAAMFENNQVKRVTMVLDGQEAAIIRFPRMTEAQGVFTVLGSEDWWEGATLAPREVDERIAATPFKTIRFVIDEVYRGTKHNDTCISALSPALFEPL